MSTQEKNGKVSFMLAPSLHRRLRIAAAEEGVRLSALVGSILSEELDYRDTTRTDKVAPAISNRDPGDETNDA